MKYYNKNIIYTCEVWTRSTNLNSLKIYSLLLPLSHISTGLPTKIKRFTLLRSPLGNKRSKDQFERREYKSFFSFQSKDPSKILALLYILQRSSNIKSKLVFSLFKSSQYDSR
ncbi:unnamed protein product [Ectocarpus sp. 8 AP-2014]